MTANQGNVQTIWLEPSVQHLLGTHLLTCHPQEACGILLGAAAAGGMLIDNYVPLSNVAPDPLHAFVPDPIEWVRALYNQPRRIGLFHSHPHSAPWPSAADIAGLPSLGPEFHVYLIGSPRSGQIGDMEMNAFHIERRQEQDGRTRSLLSQAQIL